MKVFRKSALVIGSAIAARQLARLISGVDVDGALGTIGLERRHGAGERVASAVGFTLLGAAVGAGVALLFAPSSGAELRERISHQVDDAGQKLRHLGENARQQFAAEHEGARQHAGL